MWTMIPSGIRTGIFLTSCLFSLMIWGGLIYRDSDSEMEIKHDFYHTFSYGSFYQGPLYKLIDIAEDGDVEAMIQLSIMYRESILIDSGYQSIEWYNKATRMVGRDRAQYNLGKAYFSLSEETVDIDTKRKYFNKAYKLLLESASQGYHMSIFYIAVIYDLGIGVKQNTSIAIQYYHYFLNSGKSNFSVQNRLADIYRSNESDFQNLDKSVQLYISLSQFSPSMLDSYTLWISIRLKLISTYYQMGEYSKAIDWAIRSITNSHRHDCPIAENATVSVCRREVNI